MTDVTVPFTGWGRAGFGELAWNEGSVAVGSATGEVGTVTVVEGTGVVVNVTGVEATGAVGDVTVVADANVPATGLGAGRLQGRLVTLLLWPTRTYRLRVCLPRVRLAPLLLLKALVSMSL
jgi:hypothetical protein